MPRIDPQLRQIRHDANMNDAGLDGAHAPSADDKLSSATVWRYSKIRLLISTCMLISGLSIFSGINYSYVPSGFAEGWLAILASTLCCCGAMSIASGYDLKTNRRALQGFVAAPGALVALVAYFSFNFPLLPDFDYGSLISNVFISFGILWALAAPSFIKTYLTIASKDVESGPSDEGVEDATNERRRALTVATWCLAFATLLAPVIGWLLSKI